jgi:hypothetical protein
MPGLPEQHADGPTTKFTPTGSSMRLPVKSAGDTPCGHHLGYTGSPGSQYKNPASSSDVPGLPSVTNADVPEPKTPVDAIAGGKYPVTL